MIILTGINVYNNDKVISFYNKIVNKAFDNYIQLEKYRKRISVIAQAKYGDDCEIYLTFKYTSGYSHPLYKE